MRHGGSSDKWLTSSLDDIPGGFYRRNTMDRGVWDGDALICSARNVGDFVGGER
jgi:hypothetical protein